MGRMQIQMNSCPILLSEQVLCSKLLKAPSTVPICKAAAGIALGPLGRPKPLIERNFSAKARISPQYWPGRKRLPSDATGSGQNCQAASSLWVLNGTARLDWGHRVSGLASMKLRASMTRREREMYSHDMTTHSPTPLNLQGHWARSTCARLA